MAPRTRKVAATAVAATATVPPFHFPTGPILETDFVNTPGPSRRGNWTSRVAGGRVIYDPRGGPKYGYMPVHEIRRTTTTIH